MSLASMRAVFTVHVSLGNLLALLVVVLSAQAGDLGNLSSGTCFFDDQLPVSCSLGDEVRDESVLVQLALSHFASSTAHKVPLASRVAAAPAVIKKSAAVPSSHAAGPAPVLASTNHALATAWLQWERLREAVRRGASLVVAQGAAAAGRLDAHVSSVVMLVMLLLLGITALVISFGLSRNKDHKDFSCRLRHDYAEPTKVFASKAPLSSPLSPKSSLPSLKFLPPGLQQEQPVAGAVSQSVFSVVVPDGFKLKVRMAPVQPLTQPDVSKELHVLRMGPADEVRELFLIKFLDEMSCRLRKDPAIEECFSVSWTTSAEQLAYCEFKRRGSRLQCDIYRSGKGQTSIEGFLREEMDHSFAKDGSTVYTLFHKSGKRWMTVMAKGNATFRNIKIANGSNFTDEMASTIHGHSEDDDCMVECYPGADVGLVVIALAAVGRLASKVASRA